jgi:hypothetical protein
MNRFSAQSKRRPLRRRPLRWPGPVGRASSPFGWFAKGKPSRFATALIELLIRSTRLDESIFTGKEVLPLAKPVPSGLNLTHSMRQIHLSR